MTHPNIDSELDYFAGAILSDDCDQICDAITSGRYDPDLAIRSLIDALKDDPDCSFHAAHIRDAIRDNIDMDMIDALTGLTRMPYTLGQYATAYNVLKGTQHTP